MGAILYGTLWNTISKSSQISNTRQDRWVLVFDPMCRVNERNMSAILYGTLWNTISKSSQISNTTQDRWVLVFDPMCRVNERNMSAILYDTVCMRKIVSKI